MSRIAKAAGVVLGAGAVVLSGTGLAMADADAEARPSARPVSCPATSSRSRSTPVNVCGNTINVIGLLNPASGNACENGDDDKKDESDKHGEDGKNEDGENGGYGG